MTHREIVQACKPILETVEFHVTDTVKEQRFMTAYQIWLLLRRGDNPICQRLIDDCGGEFVGKHAGSHVGPAQKIAQALGNSQEIDKVYLDNSGIRFGGIEPAGPDCGLFRLKQNRMG